ncbi:hypothetical protein K443DRAFT_679454 [Laccaria amethystina LaAM-08-1]|uniref:Uncharacterized protein n=1 Tax=Laccaria amethystina LaAM-08-1 TaxID=1095629 RepID=A0A0C9X504_9AGAR|nr:hypothetical protein K443DRAFT_679454 [Laccaria amethystina LaAM-08-1]
MNDAYSSSERYLEERWGWVVLLRMTLAFISKLIFVCSRTQYLFGGGKSFLVLTVQFSIKQGNGSSYVTT